METLSHIRNFCIIAHIDHGKSTLADRILQLTHAVDERLFRDQLLDSMDLERERGITIKSHPVSMAYRAQDGRDYMFNLIDTPGHVDFSYEVSRSMAACEGALLVIDATQGVEAQTVANVYLAMDRGLEIIPVINKTDLPNSDVAGTRRQLEDVLGIEADAALIVSAKTGDGVAAVLETVVEKVPPPVSLGAGAPPRALIFDSVFDIFRGVIPYVRMIDGVIRPGDSIRMMARDVSTLVREVGMFSPQPRPVDKLQAGQVGYLVGVIKDPADIGVGDTITLSRNGAVDPLPGFQEVHPMVFCGVYPVGAEDYEKFRQSLEKLRLNDAAFTFHPENSVALGFGFRCGFLGLLHMEIVQERLRREFDLDILSTYPAVVYRIILRDGSEFDLDNPVDLPETTRIERIEEPMLSARIICRGEQIGDVMRLIMERRGDVTSTETLDSRRVMISCTMPLNEILVDFHDSLKSVSRGYASMDYEPAGYRPGDIVRMDIMLNGEPVDAFSCMVHRDKAVARGRQVCKALKEAIPPHMFQIPIQAAIGRNIIARETIRAFRKDVTAKLYGGDVTRKQKLLKKQKEGKKRMKQCGKVNVPQEAFISVLRNSDD